MTGTIQPEANQLKLGRLSRYAWLPIPLLLALIVALWVADLRAVYESRSLMVLLNIFFTWLAALCICYLTARGFLSSGQPGLLMFGCGSLMWGFTSLIAAMMVGPNVNPTITVHNVGVFGAALCHFIGLNWHGKLSQRGRWLVAGYAVAMLTSILIVWAASTGLTPLFFIQGHGGTLIRQIVLLMAISLFAWVAWQLIYKFWRQAGAFYYYYWYGLGLAMVATGLVGVMLLSVQGGIMGWTNRLTQYFGSAYLFVAAILVTKETGAWIFSLTAVEEAWQKGEFPPNIGRQSLLGWVKRYGLAAVAVAAAMGFRLFLEAWAGSGLPPYITFFPAVMMVALLAGFGPGLVATALSGIIVIAWISSTGIFFIESPADRIGLVIFCGMGLFMCTVADLYRRNRNKATAYEREAALHEGQERLAVFAEATFEGIAESKAGIIVDCNEQLARMLGYTVDELKGMQIANFIVPEDRDRVLASIQEARESAVEHAMLCKDGTRIIVEAHGRPVSPGSMMRHTAVRDITERKHTENSLQATLHRLHSFVANLHSSIVFVGDEDRIILANQAFCDYFGLPGSPADLVGISARELVDKLKDAYLHPGKEVTRIREIVSRGETVIGEEIAMRGGRTCIRDFINITVDGKSFGRLWQHVDITSRKQAEKALAERSAELEAANKELEAFAFAVSHDLRAPLRHIEGFISMLSEDYSDKLDGTGKDIIGRVQAGAGRMQDIINALLGLSRVSRSELNRTNVDLSALAKTTAADLKKNQPDRDVEFIIADDLMADGDQPMLQAMIDNLIGNAWKYTAKRPSARIEFGATREEGENVFFVADNGAGFDKQYAAKLFKPFQRLHSEAEFPGIGIGLSIVQRIVHRHGGHIWAEGEVTKGATFYFTLH